LKGKTMALNVSKDEALELVGKEVGLSDWLAIEQTRIDTFADATNDHQFIHVDPAAAAQTPFGSTIAHGFLSLSLLTDLAGKNGIHLDDTTFVVNYGINKLRFLSPVKVDDQVRARVTLNEFEEKRPGQYLITMGVVIELQNQEKPALIAEWLVMAFTQ
jgi:acyl dehydratase